MLRIGIRKIWVVLSLTSVLSGSLGCSGDGGLVVPSSIPQNPVEISADAGPTNRVPNGGLLGTPCEFSAECRAGLICDGEVCIAPGDKPQGSTCLISGECEEELTCSLPPECLDGTGDISSGACAPVCTEAGDAQIGHLCYVNADCEAYLYCDFVGIVGTCEVTGQLDVSESCDSSKDCAAGLLCRENVCNSVFDILANLSTFRECEPDDGVGRVLFEVPTESSESEEFYRLPFPNDIRVTGGKIDLTGHPVIGDHVYNLDPAARIVEALSNSSHGFSNTGAIYFRFSRVVGLSEIVIGADQAPEDQKDTLALVDITPASSNYGERQDILWSAEMGGGSGGRYICDNWLMVRPLFLRPLTPGRTYAALVMKGLKDGEGVPLIPDTDFETMLSDTEPSGDKMRVAWGKYKPLRDFLGDGSVGLPVGANRLLGAAVFTVGKSDQSIRQIRQTVSAGPGPSPRELSLCANGSPQGCALPSGQEGCFGTSNGYDEIHGILDLPRLRNGDGNFLYPDSGGKVSEPAEVMGLEAVCFALSIPSEEEMPEEGWPLVLYGHGTLGDRRSPYQDGTVDALSNLQNELGKQGVAVLSVDQLFHGSRSIDSPFGPEFTYQNLGNPAAISGNVLQSVGEFFQLEKFSTVVDWTTESSPTGKALKFDLDHLYVYGHSVGGTAGLVAGSQSLNVKGFVVGGVGGGLPLSLMERTNPQPLPALLGLYFADLRPSGESRVTQNHPLVSLLHHLAGPADLLSVAEQLFVSPPELTPAKHVFLVWGIGDTFVGDSSVKSLASAMRLTQVEPIEDKVVGVVSAPAPATVTWPLGITAVISDHVPVGYDGHFVLQQHPDARRQATQFMGTAVSSEDGIPTLVP